MAIAATSSQPSPVPLPTTPPTAQPSPELRFVSIGSITPSKTNPRKSFDGPEFQELVASIRQDGVLQPVLLRPTVRHALLGQQYELVCGERRWRASKEAGKLEIPSIIRELTDQQAREAQIVENLQRKDVSPLEEAAGFRALIDELKKAQPKATQTELVAEIAAKIGKGVRYVWSRMKLDSLVPEAKRALTEGRMEASHADILVTYPENKQRQIFFDNFCEELYDDEDAAEAGGAVFSHVDREINGDDEPMKFAWARRTPSVREFKQRLESDGTELKRAPWKWQKDDPAAAVAVAPWKAGTPNCVGCEFNTAAQEGGDPKRALCLNEECFDSKRTQFVQIQVKTSTELDGKPPVQVSDSYYEATKGVLAREKWAKASRGSCDSVVAAVMLGYDGKPSKFLHVCTNTKCKVHFKKTEESRPQKSAEQIKAEADRKAENALRLAIAKKVIEQVTSLPDCVLRDLASSAADGWRVRQNLAKLNPTAQTDLKRGAVTSAAFAKACVGIVLAPSITLGDYDGVNQYRKEFHAVLQALGFNPEKERAAFAKQSSPRAGASSAVEKAAPKAGTATSKPKAATKAPAVPKKSAKKSAKKGGRK